MAQSLVLAAPVLPLLPYLAARVDENGITAPSYADILGAIQSAYQAIFGADAYIEPDSQDGQLLAIFAKAISDSNDAAIACYNSYSPSTAVGAGLSSVVKINGIKRKIPSNSSAIVRLRGVAGTEVSNGVVTDNLGFNWSLPNSVIIPNQGEIQVTAVCQTFGSVVAGIGTINQIATPIPGWQTVSNDMAAAVPGAPVENDAQLRRRQTFSTSLPSLSVLDGIVGAVWEIPGAVRVKGYENPLDYTDPITHQPPHSISIVSQGGDTAAICQTIALKKTPGSQTTGDVAQMVVDPFGIPNVVRYWQLILVPLTVIITVTPLPGYNSGTSTMIRASVIEFINRLDIGETSYHNRLFAPANLAGDAATDITGQTQQQLDAISETYNIAKIEQGVMQPYMGFDVESANIDGFDVGSWTPRVVMVEADLPINFREAFTSDGTRVGVVIAPIPGLRL